MNATLRGKPDVYKKIACAAVFAGTVTCLAGVAINRSADRVKTNLDVGFKRIGTLVQRGVDDVGESGFIQRPVFRS